MDPSTYHQPADDGSICCCHVEFDEIGYEHRSQHKDQAQRHRTHVDDPRKSLEKERRVSSSAKKEKKKEAELK